MAHAPVGLWGPGPFPGDPAEWGLLSFPNALFGVSLAPLSTPAAQGAVDARTPELQSGQVQASVQPCPQEALRAGLKTGL